MEELLSRACPAQGETSFTRQQAPRGLGHAVWCARDIVGDEPFALLLPDMLHHGSKSCLAEMIEAYETTGGNLIAVSPVPEDQTHQYGIVGVEDAKAKVSRITSMVEKPPKGTAPSNLHITGRYILEPDIFPLLAKQEAGAGGEIQLTDAMITLSKDAKQPVPCGPLRRLDLRLRVEDRLPARQRRLRALSGMTSAPQLRARYQGSASERVIPGPFRAAWS